MKKHLHISKKSPYFAKDFQREKILKIQRKTLKIRKLT